MPPCLPAGMSFPFRPCCHSVTSAAEEHGVRRTPLSALSPFPLFPCSPSHHSVPATTTAAPLAATAGAHLSAQTQLWRGSAICGMSQAPTLIWPIRTVSRLNRCFYYHTIIDRVAYLIIRLLDHDG